MELDDFKQAWRQLDRQLQQQAAVQLAILRQSKLEQLRRGLRWLQGGQVLQMVLGVVLVGWSVPVWLARLDHPAIVVAGVAVTAYGYGLLGLGAWVSWRATHIDYAAPVLQIQRQLLQLQHSYRRALPWTGLPWWLLWVAAVMLLVAEHGVDLFALQPRWVWAQLAVGVTGWLLSGWFFRWIRRPGHERLARYWQGRSAGKLRAARAILDELARFERE